MINNINNNVIPKKKIKTKISYLIGRKSNESTSHLLSINKLYLDNDKNKLFSASRDATIICWSLPSSTSAVATFDFALEGHTDWVNDVVPVSLGKGIISCSSDSTIKFWSTRTKKCVKTLTQHKDYVKCLAYASSKEIMASAGFDAVVHFWDIDTAISISSSSSSTETTLPYASGVGHKESIYSLACNTSGSVFVSGGTETVIRGWDPRTGEKIFKLKGHKDNIRCLAVSEDGNYCISGSSDQEIRLWDIGQQRCIQTIDVHSDSVWAIAADANFNRILSGGRDGCIYLNDIKQRTSTFVCCESSSIQSLTKFQSDSCHFWSSTSDSSSINLWYVNDNDIANSNNNNNNNNSDNNNNYEPHSQQPQQQLQRLRNNPSFSYSASPMAARMNNLLVQQQLQQHKEMQNKNDDSAVLSTSMYGASFGSAVSSIYHSIAPSSPISHAPQATIKGKAGLMKHHVLNNKMEVLTQDTNNNVSLWNVVTCKKIADFGQVSFSEKVESLFEMVTVPSWFTVDTKIGSIMVHLEPTSCFNAEIYASDVSKEYEFQEDLKVNLGDLVLRSLFSKWMDSQMNAATDGTETPPTAENNNNNTTTAAAAAATTTTTTTTTTADGNTQSQEVITTSQQLQQQQQIISEQNNNSNTLKEKFKNTLWGKKDVQISDPFGATASNSQANNNTTTTTTATTTTTTATNNDNNTATNNNNNNNNAVAPFILDESISVFIFEDNTRCVFRDTVGDMSEANEDYLPPWLLDCLLDGRFQSRDNLKGLFFLEPAQGGGLPPLPHGSAKLSALKILKIKKVATYVATRLNSNNNNNNNGVNGDDIELFCNDKLCPPTMSIGTVRQFLWKNPDDLILQYREKQNNNSLGNKKK